MRGVLDAALDLLLGSSCVGCGRPGRLLCAACAAEIPHRPFAAWPTPTPRGLVEPWAGAAYDGTVRAMIIGLKERQLLGLARPLAELLARAVSAGVPPTTLTLVPVPSRRATVRARGHDPTATITAGAAALLRRDGYRASAVRLLSVRSGVADQSDLDAAARAANLAGAMRLSRSAPARAVEGPVVICDDVITTGATAREAQRALASSGLSVVRVASVAATALRRSHGENSADSLSSGLGTN